MSHQPAAVIDTRGSGDRSNAIEPDGEGQAILDALDDADCRAILDATSAAALSANEISEACDLPLSTAYRKIDRMVEAGVLEERTRIGQSGKHASEYASLVEAVEIAVADDGGMTVRVSRRGDAGGREGRP